VQVRDEHRNVLTDDGPVDPTPATAFVVKPGNPRSSSTSTAASKIDGTDGLLRAWTG
jgi:hypothetical protein